MDRLKDSRVSLLVGRHKIGYPISVLRGHAFASVPRSLAYPGAIMSSMSRWLLTLTFGSIRRAIRRALLKSGSNLLPAASDPLPAVGYIPVA